VLRVVWCAENAFAEVFPGPGLDSVNELAGFLLYGDNFRALKCIDRLVRLTCATSDNTG
jgi:hypothetical protein